MLFRPKFCANCGEKIERSDWGPFTSRRFCPVCESEFKGHDLIPRVIVGFGALAGVIGVWSYVKSGPRVQDTAILRPRAAVQPSPNVPPVAVPTAVPAAPQASPAVRQLASQPPPPSAVVRAEATEEAYFCGAETKKGTPCSRRVKGNIRCYQHKGMPAMLPADKLRIG